MKIPNSSIPAGPADGGVETLCNRCGESCWRFVRTRAVTCPTCGGFEWIAHAGTVDEQRERQAIVEACANCDEDGTVGKAPLDPPENHGLYAARVEYSGGYLSDPLQDLRRYSFELCEKCLVWLFGQFKLPVTVTDLMPGDER